MATSLTGNLLTIGTREVAESIKSTIYSYDSGTVSIDTSDYRIGDLVGVSSPSRKISSNSVGLIFSSGSWFYFGAGIGFAGGGKDGHYHTAIQGVSFSSGIGDYSGGGGAILIRVS